MSNIKVIHQSEQSRMLYQCEWLVEKTVEFSELIIRERANLAAPEGKKLTLLVNGVVRDIRAGKYTGRVVLDVSDLYIARPEGLMVFNQIEAPMSAAICIEDGKVTQTKSISEAVCGGDVSDSSADGIYIAASAEAISGVIVDNSDYNIKNARMDIEGFGRNDYAGSDTGVTILGKSNVKISDSVFNMSGVTRCAIHVSGDSKVKVENCDIVNFSPETHWIGRFCWMVSLRGSNRLCQLAGNGQVEYINCRLKTNGWGVLSIDGSDEFVSMLVKDSTLELSGPRAHGYGTFCIGPNHVTVDNSVMDVYGFPMLIMGMGGARPSIINGSVIKGRRFGAMAFSDDNSIFTIKDSTFDTAKANIVLKASATTINIENSVMKSGNGVLLQLMDSDECGMDVVKFHLPVGVADTPIEGRDLTVASERDDVILNLANMSVESSIFNSTTNIQARENAEREGMGVFHDTLVGPVGFNGSDNQEMSNDGEAVGHSADELHAPKNLGVNAKNAHITGMVSSAIQAYREGVATITEDNWFDISNITQTAAAPVNNGVILSLDSKSSWTVTGTSWLTRLIVEDGAEVKGIDGRKISMTVNGTETNIAAGEYEGVIKVNPV